MSRWLSRLDVKFQKPLSGGTAKTDKTPPETPYTPLLSVLSVLPERGFAKHKPPFVSFVSAAGEANTETRAASNDEVGALEPVSGNPYLSRESADRCHVPGWSEAEMFAFTTRSTKFVRIGLRPDADHLAELLTLRDRDGDNRRLCFECQHYRPGRCGNHGLAGLRGPDLGRDLAGLLQRCPGFIA